MSNEEINKVLSDIYSDLENLQSARTQVKIVTENSKELTQAISTLLNEIKAFANAVEQQNIENKDLFSENINYLKEKTEGAFQKNDDLISQSNNLLKGHIEKSANEFSEQIKNVKQELDQINSENNKSIQNSITTFTNEINLYLQKTEQNTKNIQDIATNTIKTQETIIAKTISEIENANSTTKELIQSILDYNIVNNLNELNLKVDNQIKTQSYIKKILVIIISILGIIGIMEFLNYFH